MADNSVFITGAANGAFTEALSGMPAWATERTLKNIEMTLKQSLGLSKQLLAKLGKGGGSLDPATIKELEKVMKEYTDTLNKSDNKEADREKNRKDLHDKYVKRNKELTTGLEKYRITVNDLYRVNTNIVGAMEDNVRTFAQLQQGGINVVAGLEGASTGFTSLQQITALTGVRFTELSATMLKYSTTVNAFTSGKFAKTVGEASSKLQLFGFTSKESAELLGSYLESQSGYTDMMNQSSTETALKLQKFGSNLSKVSMVTGMAKNAILANMEAISKSNEASILSANIGEDAATSTLTFISSMKDQNLGRAFLKMMTDQIKPLNSTFMSFQKIGLGGFGQKLMNFTQSLKGMDPARQAQAIKAFEAQNRAAIEAGKQQANLYSQIPELAAEAQAALTTFNGLQQQARATKEMTEADMKKMEASNKARANLASQWEALVSKFQLAFGPPISLLELLGTGLETINKGLDKFIGWLNSGNDEMSSWIGVFSIAVASVPVLVGALSLLTSIVGKLGSSIIGLITGPFKFAGRMIARMFGKGAAAAANSTRGAAGSTAGTAGGGLLEGLGKGLSGLGKGIAGLGKGLGGAVGGMLQGLARGLVALGNPRVLLGIVTLTGVGASLWVAGKGIQQFIGLDWETMGKAGVTLIALGAAGVAASAAWPAMLLGAVGFAALGASLWVVGKGVQQFTGLDWETMGKAGATLVALGIAGAAAGAATPAMLLGAAAFAALGASLWVVGNALTVMGTAVNSVGSIFGNVSNGISMLSRSVDSFKNLDKLKDIIGTINSVNLLKAAAFAAISAVSPSTPSANASSISVPRAPTSTSIDSPSTKKPSSKSSAQQQTDAVGASAGPGIEKTPAKNDINSMMSFQNSLLEQLLLSTNSLVSVNKDILKYTRAHQ